ncbi:hypothetical protein EVJ58_g3854 [Rhodofomes roseus]|uniref:Uncharacterized protein n=1 Tax=Rhodofomes roseus TaxID=34475 RepID=A0A4Y9YL53_9APHY|nr:hypothetical protein EVJ58_g3854 [Rhodofomes roseus]
MPASPLPPSSPPSHSSLTPLPSEAGSAEPRSRDRSPPPLPSLLEAAGLYQIAQTPPPSDEPVVAHYSPIPAAVSEQSILPSSPVRTVEDARRKAKAAREQQRLAREETQRRAKAAKQQEICQLVLSILNDNDVPFGELLEFISDPSNQQGRERYWGLFIDTTRVQRILNFWVSSENSSTGRNAVQEWAINLVSKLVAREARTATKDRLLQTEKRAIDEQFALGFSMAAMHSKFVDLCPTMLQVLDSFSSTTRQRRELTPGWEARHSNASSYMLFTPCKLTMKLITNNYARHVFGLFAYASGAKRQMIEFLSHIGVTSSYSIITADLKGHETEVTATASDLDRESSGRVELQTQVLPSETSRVGPTTAVSPGEGSTSESDSDLDSDSDSDALDSEQESPNPPSQAITTPVTQAKVDDIPGDLPSQTTTPPNAAPADRHSPLADDPARSSGDMWAQFEAAVAAQAEEDQADRHSPFAEDLARSSDDMWAQFEAVVATQAEEDQAPGRAEEHQALTMGVVETMRELRRADEEPEANGQGSPEKSRAVVGLLKRLSDACKRAARAKASSRVLAFVYDNINMLFRVAEARMEATGKDALQNGTCATAFALYNAEPEDLLTSDYLSSFARAPPLTLHDVLLTPAENQAFSDLLRHTVLSIIVNYGGPAFAVMSVKVTLF